MRFTLLGDVSATRDGAPLDAGPARQRCVLAALLLDLNRVVPMGELIDRVWATRVPRRARETLRSYISRLRACVGTDDVGLERRSGGYLLRADPATVDLFVFRELVDKARAADDRTAIELYRQAVSLWHGAPFGTLDTPWLAGVRDRLEAERLTADLDRIDLELRLCPTGRLVTELVGLAGTHPLDERVTGQLMLALYRDGRQGEALDQYQQARLRLRDELGVDPAPALQRLHRRMLVGDPGLAPGPVIATPAPAQLPPGPGGFAGRGSCLAGLDDLLSSGSGTVVAALSGPAGVGKTALALHWAHRVADRFPDGQLYVNLRGFDAQAPAMGPAEALRGFLVALGVAPQRIPAGVEELAGLYRALVSGRRLLVVLDNANGADQVRPLLPATPSCLTLITSRDQLVGLVAADGARPIAVGLLTAAESRKLLVHRLGPRVDTDRSAVARMIRSCARLPLALAVMAARAATRPHLPLAAIAAELRERGTQLDALATGDPRTDMRSVFSWSYLRLSRPAGRVFRLLGRQVGPDISVAAAASLVALPVYRLRPLLGELVEANLIVEHTPGRYSMHDLLSAYAAELSESSRDSAAGRHRLLDHYLRTAHAAAMLIDPYRDPISLPPSPAGTTPEPIATAEEATAWLTTEHHVLLAAIAQPDLPAHRWRLAWCVVNLMDRRGYWHEQADSHRAALAAAVREADPIGQAHSHRGLGRAYIQLNHHAQALRHFDLAIACCRAAGDDLLQALVLRNIAELMEREQRYDSAVAFAEQAIELFRVAGHRAGLSNTLHQLGWYRALLGDHERALADLGSALELLEADDHRYGQAHTLDSLGYTHHQLGDHRLAISCLRRAVRLFKTEGDRYYQAISLDHLGNAHRSAGEQADAEDAWHRALAILEDLAHPDARRVRIKLR